MLTHNFPLGPGVVSANGQVGGPTVASDVRRVPAAAPVRGDESAGGRGQARPRTLGLPLPGPAGQANIDIQAGRSSARGSCQHTVPMN